MSPYGKGAASVGDLEYPFGGHVLFQFMHPGQAVNENVGTLGRCHFDPPQDGQGGVFSTQIGDLFVGPEGIVFRNDHAVQADLNGSGRHLLARHAAAA